jgi:hypothetical protein
VNQPAAAQCLLDRLGPLPPASTGTATGERSIAVDRLIRAFWAIARED